MLQGMAEEAEHLPDGAGLSLLASEVHVWTDAVPVAGAASNKKQISDDDNGSDEEVVEEEEEEKNWYSEETIAKKQKRKPKGQRKHSFTDGDDNNDDDDDDDDGPDHTTTAGSSSKSRKQYRQRSGSGSGKQKKKVHPRSKQATTSSAPQNNIAAQDDGVSGRQPQLCRSYFFRGKCDSPRRRGCPHEHGNTFSLYQVLMGPSSSSSSSNNNNNANKQALKEAEQVIIINNNKYDDDDHHEEEEGGDDSSSCPMVYYLPFKNNNNDNREQRSSRAILQQALDRFRLKASNLVYVVMNHVLVYDRYRNGCLYHSKDDLIRAVTMGPAAPAAAPAAAAAVCSPTTTTILSTSSSKCWNGDNKMAGVDDVRRNNVAMHLPGTVLEHILAFLPDRAVSSMSKVAKQWWFEIGRSNVWKHLLQRRHWPFDEKNSDSENLRQQFFDHYIVVRDVRALQVGLDDLVPTHNARRNVSTNHGAGNEDDYSPAIVAVHDFSKHSGSRRRHHPQALPEDSICVGVQQWAPNQILVAYDQDCSLRLFESTPGNDGSLQCRQVLCQTVDPYKHTKRRTCVMSAMGLDDECVACLCHVKASTVPTAAFVLVVMSRDDFLISQDDSALSSSSSSSEHLKVIDIGQACLNYLLSSDLGDHRLSELIDFLSEDHGDITDVEVDVTQDIAACGYGRFLLDVSISIPHPDDADGGGPLLLVARRLVLFSASAGAVVWIGDSCAPGETSRHLNLSSLLKRQGGNGTRTHCTFAAQTNDHPITITVGDIDPSGHVCESGLNRYSFVDSDHTMLPGDQTWEAFSQEIIVTPTDFVACRVLTARQAAGGHESSYKSLMHFRSLYTGSDKQSTLALEGNLRVNGIHSFRHNYLIFLGQEFPPYRRNGAANHDEVEEPDQAVVGQWFAPPAQAQAPVTADTITSSLYAVIVHVPSRKEIARVCLIDDPVDCAVQLNANAQNTLSLAYGALGVILTGSAVREVVALGDTMPRSPVSHSAKKKKKRQPNRGGKKDGFARGMSLRG